MMKHLMTVSIKGPSLDDYNAERAIQLKYNTGQNQILWKIMIMIKMKGVSQLTHDPQAIPQNYKNEEINDKTNGNLII